MQGMVTQGPEGEIKVTRGFMQNFGVLTAVAEKGTIPVDIRTVGILAYNDQKIVSVNTKFEGWIQEAYVNYIGRPVRAGEPLFEIYSPELVSTETDRRPDGGRRGHFRHHGAGNSSDYLLSLARKAPPTKRAIHRIPPLS
jgi:hypothetical protein